MSSAEPKLALLRTACVVLLVVLSFGRAASAQDLLARPVRVDIPRGMPLDLALVQLARQITDQTGIHVMLASDLVENRKTEGLTGTLPASAALARLLQGTELTYAIDENTVTIHPMKNTVSAGEGSVMRLVQSEQAPADAEEGNTDSEQRPAATRTEGISEIVVTAQKREQRTVDIPMTVGVLGAEEIERKGITDMMDLSYATPGMMVQEFGPGRQVIFMRGVANLVGSESLTSVYLDEAPATSGANHPLNIGQLDLRTTDLERVEVLKGPQGTLYGSGAVSGTVRFITADPKLDGFGGKADVAALFTEDGDPSERLSAVINAPVVTDVFGLRLAATFENNGGWIDRPSIGRSDVNENELSNVRLKSLWRISDAFDIKAMAIVHRNRDRDSGGVNHSDEDGNFTLPVDPNREYPFRDDYELYNLTATYDFGGVSLLSSSSYVDQDSSYLYTIIPGPETRFLTIDTLLTNAQSKQRFSQELRLTSSGQRAFKWTVGAFYQDVEDHVQLLNETIIPAIDLYLTIPGDSAATSTSWAAFADGSYAVTDRLELGVGVRYFEDDRSSTNLVVASESQNASFDKLTWRMTARYSLTDQANVYANIATGFRSGGFNGYRNNVPDPPFQPETLLTYELGSKMLFQEGRGHLDLALFYSEYDDYLRRGFEFDPDAGGYIGLSSNFGDVTIKGLDLSASISATKDMTLYLNGAYTDAEITRINTFDPDNNLARPGDPVDYIPEVSYTIGGEYRFSWTDSAPGFLQIDYNYRDKVSVIDRSITLIPTMYSDDIRLLNARLGATFDRWSMQLFGENLTNENGSFDPWIIFNQAVRNRPRTYGVKVGFDFQ